MGGAASLKRFNIAIDGPAGAGKSTVARLVAGRLGYVYIDTGAMYRAVTWKVLQLELTVQQQDEIIHAAEAMQIELKAGPHGQMVFVDGVERTQEIRSSEVTKLVSHIASIGPVRELLVRKQQIMAAAKGVVMDGRDIGTHVLPDAEIKIFLTASVRQRAERRFRELQSTEPDLTIEQLEQDIARRDKLDEEREISPLRRTPDAVLLDSTNMTIEDVVDAILNICKDQLGWGNLGDVL